MKTRLILINVFSMADSLLTYAAVRSGKATEANPLMNVLLESSVFSFIFIKALLTLLGSYILWRNITNQYAIIATRALAIGYGALIIYHFIGRALSNLLV